MKIRSCEYSVSTLPRGCSLKIPRSHCSIYVPALAPPRVPPMKMPRDFIHNSLHFQIELRVRLDRSAGVALIEYGFLSKIKIYYYMMEYVQ